MSKNKSVLDMEKAYEQLVDGGKWKMLSLVVANILIAELKFSLHLN